MFLRLCHARYLQRKEMHHAINTVNRSRHKVKYDTQCDKVASSEGKLDTCEAYFALHMSSFLTHGVPNTPQVKPTEDTCEAYFTQHVSNVTLCRCQIYSECRRFFN
jgi:hypothetical protein